jgi:voltage-gated potassium channel Kch
MKLLGSKLMIIGSSHLAYRAIEKLSADFEIVHVASDIFKEKDDTDLQESSLDYAKKVLEEKHAKGMTAICILDNTDRGADKINLHLLSAAIASVNDETPIYVSIWNDNLAVKLQEGYKNQNLHIYNQAAVSSEHFVKALTEEIKGQKTVGLNMKHKKIARNGSNSLIKTAVICFLILVAFGTSFFHFSEGLPWLDSVYYMSTVWSSVSFNDTNVKNYAIWAISGRIVLLFTTPIFIVFVFGVAVNEVFQKIIEAKMFGRRRYNLKDHVIICGLGRVGHIVVEKLRKNGVKVVVIEENEHNPFLDTARTLGAKVIIGDAVMEKNLEDASIKKAAALMALTNEDTRNMEIGLNARTMNPPLRLILRIFDKSVAEELKEKFGINSALSTSDIAAETMTKDILKQCRYDNA